MSRTLPKQFNPLITIEVAPTYDELLARRRLGQTNLSVKPAQIGTSNATKPENLGVFEYAHLRAPLPKDLEGSEIFPSHTSQQHPESYFLMRRSKDGFVSATGMFKIAFPWAKAEEERTEREYLKAREHTSEEEVAGNVWISPTFALELSKEYQMYDWVRALLDPTDIVQSPSSAKKHITPPPKFEIPSDEPHMSQRNRRGRSASPSKKLFSPRKPRSTRSTKDVASTPSTTAANASLQSALDTASALPDTILELRAVDGEMGVASSGSPAKHIRVRRATRSATAEPEEEAKEKKKEKKKSEKKEKKIEDIKEQEEVVGVLVADDAIEAVKSTHTTISLDMPIRLPEVPSAAETEEMIAQAKEMVEEAIKAQAEGATAESTSVTTTIKRKAEDDDDDEDTSAESSQRAKKAKVLENKLKQERVRNRSIFGVSVAFALAASIPYFF
ncbi:APSES transcription factor, putative [Penicillium digitatum]|uniref:Cell pattern formation-associated protein stuA n=3 Tax=Penicillium digitatum TaxID=36651 RepID=K9G3K5_PEND2|nr:APSES transcription factor, putative [Penicillium digitatum Pd1]EKV10330.1 APSES transcription factor, putative [Penicillium digitatum Pd1]EKV15477.1 APSES transcription factor, putative [Penicillium digitatum PHI26]QQK44234.1 APSES transcription factor, putative [Penicillium digitatum]